MKPPSPATGSAMTAAPRVGHVERASVAIGIGHAVNLWCEGPESVFVRLYLARQGHGQQGPAVEGVFKAYDALPVGVIPGNLDGVFHGFGATVQQEGRLGKVPRGYLAEFFVELDGRLIGHDHETGVCEFFRLILYGLDHLRVAVPHIHDSDAAREINILVAVHVPHQGTLGRFHVDGGSTGVTGGHHFCT